MGKYLVVMVGKNSKKVNDKQTKKEKEKKKKGTCKKQNMKSHWSL